MPRKPKPEVEMVTAILIDQFIGPSGLAVRVLKVEKDGEATAYIEVGDKATAFSQKSAARVALALVVIVGHGEIEAAMQAAETARNERLRKPVPKAEAAKPQNDKEKSDG